MQMYGNFMDGISPKKQKVHEVWVFCVIYFLLLLKGSSCASDDSSFSVVVIL